MTDDTGNFKDEQPTRARKPGHHSVSLRYGGLLLLLATVSAALPVQGEAPPVAPVVLNQSLSVDEAVAAALRYSPTIQEAEQDTASAQARVRGAAAAGRPSASATLFASHSSWNNILSTPDSTAPVNLMGIPPGAFLDQNLMGMFPIYTGGRVDAAVRGARALHSAAAADWETSRQDTALQTRIAYRRALYQQSLVDAQQQNLSAAQEQLALDTTRFQVGKLAEVTLYRDRTLAANAQQEVTNARRDLQQALFALETVMGISVESQLTLTDTLQAGPAGAPALLPALLVDAAVHRPEVRAAADRTAAAAAALRRARAASNPEVNLVAMGDLTRARSSMPNGLNYTVGIAAGMPLFEGGALSSAEQEAAAELRKARAAETMVRLQVNNDVADAWSNEQAAAQSIATSQTALAQAQEDYQIQQIRFAGGKGIQLEVLDALAALTAARTQVDKASFEYAAAQDQVLRATGAILPAGAK